MDITVVSDVRKCSHCHHYKVGNGEWQKPNAEEEKKMPAPVFETCPACSVAGGDAHN